MSTPDLFEEIIPDHIVSKIKELKLEEANEHVALYRLYKWFLSVGVLSNHALRYCSICVESFGSLDALEIARTIYDGSFLNLFQATITDAAKIQKGFCQLLSENESYSHMGGGLMSRQVSNGTADSLFLSVSEKSQYQISRAPHSMSSLPFSVSVPPIVPSLDHIILVSVASPSAIQNRLAYLFAYPNYRHCFSSTLLQRHHLGTIYDEHQGQGLTGLILAPHCGKKFYSQDVGLLQHLPRLKSLTASPSIPTSNSSSPPNHQYSQLQQPHFSSAPNNNRYHPYYQSYESDHIDGHEPRSVSSSTTTYHLDNRSTPFQTYMNEAQSLLPDPRCATNDAEAMQLLSTNSSVQDLGLLGLLSHIQLQHQIAMNTITTSSSTTLVNFANEVGTIVKTPSDILGVFYYIQPQMDRLILEGRSLEDTRRQAKEVALQFGLQLFHLQIHKQANLDTGEFGTQWTKDADSV